jgi:hypothetical protein
MARTPHTSTSATPTKTSAPASPRRRRTKISAKTYLNGTLVSNIVLDTSQVATDTID